MARNDFAGAMQSLPSRFREVYAHPKISEQVKAIGHVKVKAMIQFQLGILASLMTTGGNISGPMSDFIADGLIDQYPTESIADLKLCFQRGAMGRYGQIQRMDGITVGEWMGKYLEEKYMELESNIEKRNANDVTKKPVEGLEEFYAAMKGEEAKRQAAIAFNKSEYNRRFGSVDMVAIEKQRQRERDGEHKTSVHSLTEKDFEVQPPGEKQNP